MPRHRHRANSHELRHVRPYRGKRRPIGRRRAVLLGSGPSTVIDANEPTHTEFRCAIPTDSEIAGHRNKHFNKYGCRCHLLPAPHLISETTAPLSRTCHRDHSLRILLPHKAALRPYGPSLPAHNRDPTLRAWCPPGPHHAPLSRRDAAFRVWCPLAHREAQIVSWADSDSRHQNSCLPVPEAGPTREFHWHFTCGGRTCTN